MSSQPISTTTADRPLVPVGLIVVLAIVALTPTTAFLVGAIGKAWALLLCTLVGIAVGVPFGAALVRGEAREARERAEFLEIAVRGLRAQLNRPAPPQQDPGAI